MHLENNELNDRRSQSYEKRAKQQQQQIWCGGRIRMRNYKLNYFATVL